MTAHAWAASRFRRGLAGMTVLALWAGVSPAPVSAHHAGHTLSVPSATCGWVEGDDLRDRRLAAEFCGRWIDGELGIAGASAIGERLWIEAQPTLESTLREDDRHTAALLTHWLRHWRESTGSKNASIILVSNHIEFAKIEATMAGDVVKIRF